MNKESKVVSDWMRDNKLSVNLIKSKYMIWHIPKKKQNIETYKSIFFQNSEYVSILFKT